MALVGSWCRPYIGSGRLLSMDCDRLRACKAEQIVGALAAPVFA